MNQDENKEIQTKNHLFLKFLLSAILSLLLGALSCILAYALKENTTALVLTLILVHVVEIVSLIYSYGHLYIISKNKNQKWIKFLFLILLVLIFILIALESYLMQI